MKPMWVSLTFNPRLHAVALVGISETADEARSRLDRADDLGPSFDQREVFDVLAPDAYTVIGTWLTQTCKLPAYQANQVIWQVSVSIMVSLIEAADRAAGKSRSQEAVEREICDRIEKGLHEVKREGGGG